MAFGDRLVSLYDNVALSLSLAVRQSVESYCVLESAEMELRPGEDLRATRYLIADDASVLSLYLIRGQREIVGPDEFNRLVDTLTQAWGTRLKSTGHALAISLHYDPSGVDGEMRRTLDPSRETAKRFGLDLEAFLSDWYRQVASYCAAETVLFAAWTTPAALSRAERKRVFAERGKRVRTLPQGTRSMNMGNAIPELVNLHEGFLKLIEDSFLRAGVLYQPYDARQALRALKQLIDPDRAVNWTPLLPGDPLPLRTPRPGEDPARNFDYLLYPSLKRQLFDRDATEVDSATLEYAGRLHHPLVITSPPRPPLMAFQSLFASLLREKIPWRMTFLLEGDGLNGLGLRAPLAAVLPFGRTNRAFTVARERLLTRAFGGETLVKWRASADTWVPAEWPNARHRLTRQANVLISALQGWSGANASDLIGDPLLGVCASLPGVMRSMPSYAACAPLSDAIRLLPLTRPAAIWHSGSLPLRSPDGRLLPYWPGSARQAAWVEAGVAPMGAGKSVMLNALNLAYLLGPGLEAMPYLATLDVGPSSAALIRLLQSALPADQRYLAVYRELHNSVDDAINPFDCELGCEFPLRRHKDFLVNLVCALGSRPSSDPNRWETPDGFREMVSLAIDLTYQKLSRGAHPHLYQPRTHPDLDAIIVQHHIPVERHTSWWNIVDHLMEQRAYYEASVAQRHATPVLELLAEAARDPAIQSTYGKKLVPGEGETLVDYLVRKTALEIPNRFPLLSAPTRFELREARVVALNVQALLRDTAIDDTIAYMVAQHACAGRYGLMPSDLSDIPEPVREYHRTHIAAIRNLPKRLVFDEAHRMFKLDAAVAEQLTLVRESRKWNVQVGYYSQRLTDLPKAIRELCTSIYILGVSGDPAVARESAEALGLSATAARRIAAIPPKPSVDGSMFLAVWNTEYGRLVTSVMNTVGPQWLWEATTTTEDVRVRDALYAEFGVLKSRRVLAERYPAGVKSELEQMAPLADGSLPYERLLTDLRRRVQAL